MPQHLHRDLDALHQSLLAMGGEVEEMIHHAVGGLSEPTEQRAIELAERDRSIDETDVRIEEECLKLLALHQPVAIDLRRITTVFKIASELERVADLSVHVAERSAGLVWNTDVLVPNKIKRMAGIAVDMLHRAIDSYVELDVDLALEVCEMDQVVDDMNREVIVSLKQTMRQGGDVVDSAMHLFSISRHLERVGDHATNIAEDVIYMIDARFVRHLSPAERQALDKGVDDANAAGTNVAGTAERTPNTGRIAHTSGTDVSSSELPPR